jgi:hypothetical protein
METRMLDKVTVPAALCRPPSECSNNPVQLDDGAIQRQDMALIYAGLLLSSFRKTVCDDPEGYIRAMQCVLARYDPDIQKQACEPGRWKWQPSAFELREHCDAIIAARWRVAEREEGIRRQLEERKRLDILEAERKLLAPPGPSAGAPRHPTVVGLERLEAQRILDRYTAEAAR